MSANPDHRTRRIQWGDREADVDEDLADLVLALWQVEIATSGSCQDINEDGRLSQISFPSLDDMYQFIFAVAPYDDLSACWHVGRRYDPQIEFPPKDGDLLLRRIKEFRSHRGS